MRNLNKSLLLAALLFCTAQLLAQDAVKKGDVIIHITGSGPDYNQKFLVDIYKKSSSIKIAYAVFDSIKNSALRVNREYLKVSENYFKQPGWINESKTGDSLRNFQERYSVYDRDSIIFDIKKDTVYNNLLNRFATSTKEELLQTEKDKKGVTTIMLDGVGIGYTIISDSGTKLIGVRSPRATSHPLLYNLLKSSLDIGRQHKLGPFVHRKSFSGY
jgi:hypothetical protein